jgi:hypothetical protein
MLIAHGFALIVITAQKLESFKTAANFLRIFMAIPRADNRLNFDRFLHGALTF